METSLDLLSDFAADHHGIFRLDDAGARGVSARALRGLVQRGWCERPWRAIYRVKGAPDTAEQRLTVAVWFGGDGAVGSHRAAARRWQLSGYVRAEPETTILRGRSQRKAYGLVHGSLVLPGQHVTTSAGIPVTTPARTIFDLAGVVSRGWTERSMDEALAARLCTVQDLQQVFFALARRGRRGTQLMRTLLEERGEGYAPPASELERVARQTFANAGLPMPRFEVDLGDVEWIGRVDCVWQAQRVVVELDGRRHHTAKLDRDRDRVRDNRLMAAGYRVIRVTWDDLRHRPAEVIRWIRQALAAAA